MSVLFLKTQTVDLANSEEAGDVGRALHSKHKAWGSILSVTCSLRTWKIKIREFRVHDHPKLHGKLEASLGYIRHSQNKQKTKTEI